MLAVEALDAGALEMGALEASSTAAFLVLGLPAGAWVDRMRHRRVLVVADVVRAVALASLPIALLLDAGSLVHLYVVALAMGACTVFFDVAWQSYLPAVVEHEQLVDANARLHASGSVASVAGPALGGVLLRVVGTPLVLALDAVSFVASALFIRGIQDSQPPYDPATRRPLRVEVAEGLRFVLHQPQLRRITMCTALANLALSMTGALFVLFVLRTLDLGQALLGLAFSIGAVGALVGAVLATRLARRIGEGTIMPVAASIGVAGMALLPLAGRVPVPAIAVVATSSAIGGFAGVVYNVTQVSYRQRLAPPAMLGRMNATIRFLVWGTLPVGGLLGGSIAELAGIVPTLWIAVSVAALGVLPVLALRGMRQLPGPDAARV